jgi:hypothetical protein
MSNTYIKYAPCVWLAKCPTEHSRGDIIQVASKNGQVSDCEIHNLIVKNSNGYFYSITRCDGLNRQTYAERKAEKYKAWAQSAEAKSAALWHQSSEGRGFLSLAEPIKVGHHSESRHRALIARNHKRMDKSMEQESKAKCYKISAAYWESMAGKIDLSMPESIEYFSHELEKAKIRHKRRKDYPEERLHSMALSYANRIVKDLTKNLSLAVNLWQQQDKH